MQFDLKFLILEQLLQCSKVVASGNLKPQDLVNLVSVGSQVLRTVLRARKFAARAIEIQNIYCILASAPFRCPMNISQTYSANFYFFT